MKLNILVLTEGINFGGQQYYIINLFKALKARDSDCILNLDLGYIFNETRELEILFKETFNELHHFSLPDRSKYFYLKNPIKSTIHIFKTIYAIRKRKYDVIFSNGFYSFVLCVIIKFTMGKVKHIRLVGGDLKRNEKFYFNSVFRYFTLYTYTDLVLAWPEQINYLKSKKINVRTLEKFNPLYAVDSSLFTPRKANIELKNKLKINVDCSVIGWVGRIAPDLEYHETIQLCKYISVNYPDFQFKLLVVGTGVGISEFFHQISELGLDDFLVHVPFVDQKLLPEYYSIIDFEVLLDMDPQGGSHIREAMACGCVVVSVDGISGVQSRLIKNNITGVLVKPENRIKESAERIVNISKEEKHKIGLNASIFMKNHSYSIQSTYIYEELIKNTI